METPLKKSVKKTNTLFMFKKAIRLQDSKSNRDEDDDTNDGPDDEWTPSSSDEGEDSLGQSSSPRRSETPEDFLDRWKALATEEFQLYFRPRVTMQEAMSSTPTELRGVIRDNEIPMRAAKAVVNELEELLSITRQRGDDDDDDGGHVPEDIEFTLPFKSVSDIESFFKNHSQVAALTARYVKQCKRDLTTIKKLNRAVINQLIHKDLLLNIRWDTTMSGRLKRDNEPVPLPSSFQSWYRDLIELVFSRDVRRKNEKDMNKMLQNLRHQARLRMRMSK